MATEHFFWNKETIEELLSKEDVTPEEINRTDAAGSTALIKATSLRDTSLLRELLKKEGLNINLCDIDGYNALHRATLINHADAVELLLLKGGKEIAISHNIITNGTPLYYAVSLTTRDYTGSISTDLEESRSRIVKLLLDNDAYDEELKYKTFATREKETLHAVLSSNDYVLLSTFLEHPKVNIEELERINRKYYYSHDFSIQEEMKRRSTDSSRAEEPRTASATHASDGGGEGAASSGTAPSTWAARVVPGSGGAKGK